MDPPFDAQPFQLDSGRWCQRIVYRDANGAEHEVLIATISNEVEAQAMASSLRATLGRAYEAGRALAGVPAS